MEIVHAAPEGEITPIHSESRLQEVVAEAAREALVGVQREMGADAAIVVDAGNVPRLLRSVALSRRSDLIVIGRGAIQEGFARLRANSYGIVREAPCPVLSV